MALGMAVAETISLGLWSLMCLYLLFTEAAEVDGALVPGPLLGDHLVLEGGRELDCEVARPAVRR